MVAIVSEADLARGRVVPEGWVAEGREHLDEVPVSAVMTRSPTSMRADDDLADVVALMLDVKIRSAPIVADGRMVGIVGRRDVPRAVARRELASRDAWVHRTGEGQPRARGES
ncbi:CBS domain-containing protein [Pseudonocardia acaciae]|uniref:CBS domain-containing protein n=1 Tax=Pseudonocardia acaciae TaxID=551276 RepID=UPI00316AEABC